MSFSAHSVDGIDFEYLCRGVQYYNEQIKLRLAYIRQFEGVQIGGCDFESICLQVRKIIENFAHYQSFLFEETTDVRMSKDRVIGNYNAEQILKHMVSSGLIALVSPFGNSAALEKAGIRQASDEIRMLGYKFYRDLYVELGRWLHEPTRIGRSNLDPSVFAESLHEKIEKIEASLWSHIIPSEEYSISVNYGARDTYDVSVIFNDLRAE